MLCYLWCKTLREWTLFILLITVIQIALWHSTGFTLCFAIINEEFFIPCLPHQMHPPMGKYPDHICPDHMHNVVGILHWFVTSESDQWARDIAHQQETERSTVMPGREKQLYSMHSCWSRDDWSWRYGRRVVRQEWRETSESWLIGWYIDDARKVMWMLWVGDGFEVEALYCRNDLSLEQMRLAHRDV